MAKDPKPLDLFALYPKREELRGKSVKAPEVARLASDISGFSVGDCEKIGNAYMEAIIIMLIWYGVDRVTLRNIGRFHMKKRKGYESYSHYRQEKITVPERSFLRFKEAMSIRQLINPHLSDFQLRK